MGRQGNGKRRQKRLLCDEKKGGRPASRIARATKRRESKRTSKKFAMEDVFSQGQPTSSFIRTKQKRSAKNDPHTPLMFPLPAGAYPPSKRCKKPDYYYSPIPPKQTKRPRRKKTRNKPTCITPSRNMPLPAVRYPRRKLATSPPLHRENETYLA